MRIHYDDERFSYVPVGSGHRRATMKDSLATVPSNAYLASGSRLAACAAAWCSMHCALTPLLVAVAPVLALAEGVERAVWAGTVVVGAVMVALGPARKNAVVMLTFGGGAALWAASLAGWLEPVPEAVTSAAGSLTLAGALLQSARVCQAGPLRGMRRGVTGSRPAKQRGTGPLTPDEVLEHGPQIGT